MASPQQKLWSPLLSRFRSSLLAGRGDRPERPRFLGILRGGIAEQAIGRSAPWFILGVMLFSFAVRSVYMESSGMFVRGGVYIVVRDAMGPFMARLSVSALLFDYILTGPISVVSAGQYLAAPVQRDQRNHCTGFPSSRRTVSPRYLAFASQPISGGATPREFTNRAARRCASCRSRP